MSETMSEVRLIAGNANLYPSIKSLVKQYSKLGMWSAALYWADKLLALSGASVGAAEVCLVAECMCAGGESSRAARSITSRGLQRTHLRCLYVAACALLRAGDTQQALQLLEDVDPESLQHHDEEMPKNRLLGAIAVVRGKVLSALERRAGAGQSFLNALHKDVFCTEALDYITRHHMLTPQQEVELLDSLPFDAQCSKMEACLLRTLYRSEINRYGAPLPSPATPADPALEQLLRTSSDAVEARARGLLRRGEFQECLNELGPVEGLSSRGALLRAACLAELQRAPQLFSLAHRLVDKYPQSATAWFAVGCYYYIIGKSEFARRYLSKATSLDRGMGAAWLAYGHSFALDNEHDQAMAAYFKASQLMSGCHLPLLYIGLECGLTSNARMADKFFQQALLLAPGDPHVTHEMAVIAFHNQQYEEAERLWREALNHLQTNNMLTPRWQPLLNNLGHACRKNGKLREAAGFHERALSLQPGCAGALAALGLALALAGEAPRAMDAFHSALARKPDDTFATTMLTHLVDHVAEQVEFGDSEIPDFPFPEASTLAGPVRQSAEPAPAGPNKPADYNLTCTSDMSMSFED